MKTCKKEGCTRPVFSHLFCSYHQYLRSDDKKPKKLFVHPVVPRATHSIDFGFDNQLDLFNWLWDEAKDKNGIVMCPYTGERLNCFYNTDMWLNCFAHILNKKNWTYFRLNPANIEVVFPEFHRIIDSGTFKERSEHPGWKWSVWDKKVLEMKDKYAQFKKENLLA